MTFLLLAAPEVVRMRTFDPANDENVIKMTVDVGPVSQIAMAQEQHISVLFASYFLMLSQSGMSGFLAS